MAHHLAYTVFLSPVFVRLNGTADISTFALSVGCIGTFNIEGALRCRRAVRTVGTVQICILPIWHRHEV